MTDYCDDEKWGCTSAQEIIRIARTAAKKAPSMGIHPNDAESDAILCLLLAALRYPPEDFKRVAKTIARNTVVSLWRQQQRKNRKEVSLEELEL